ncbi:MAG: PEP-CTERM sorting domain-containing protein [Acidobacteriota bacterium]
MRLLLQLSLAVLSVTLGVSGANANVVTFGDTVKVWSGLAHTPEKSTQDQNGVPDLTGGAFTYTGHTLTSITLNYANKYLNQSSWNSSWNSLQTGDWYLDVDNDKAWDYVIHKPSQVWDFTSHKMVTNNTYHLYEAEDEWLYDTQTLYGSNGKFVQYNGYYGNTDNRDWHPTTIKDTDLPYDKQVRVGGQWVTRSYNTNTGITDLGIVEFDGWDKISDLTKINSSLGVGSSTWDLSKIGGIDLTALMGKDITYAFTMTCANDILFDQTQVPTPEPGTMLLMGVGILGAGYLRRRTKASR